MTAIVWFRRDLRVHEHPALRAALDRCEHVVPVFCFDDRLLHGRHESGPRTQFLLECLHDLDSSLRDRGSRLVIRHGPPERELPALAEEVGATEIHFTADVTPFARNRGERAGRALTEAGVALHAHPGLTVVDAPGEVRTQKGKPQTVFTPYYKGWLGEPRREVAGAPRTMPALRAKPGKGRIPSLESLGLTQEVEDPLPGGEAAGRKRMNAFLRGAVADYASNHDALAEDRTSRLSPYLRFGCVSARELEDRLPAGEGPEAFRRQLAWRDFYQQVILHRPRNAMQEHRERYRGTIDWNDDDAAFDAWTDGRTGYPLVDAGMRQLRREGWMHNRARLVVGSFLTKYLGVDWRRGERWFMRLLIDGDEANNNGNWQWIASVGVDPQPAFKRIYNPALHMERFDPEGRYVRRYVPELRDVPDELLREPWEMGIDRQREVGCVIGEDYPEPIVDRREAREAALERYRV
ncbi:MAG: DNA photolyase family protein [Actinomycetota bacterium]|nr:DNA photolyase family protein [Actinomycetota bacterium]